MDEIVNRVGNRLHQAADGAEGVGLRQELKDEGGVVHVHHGDGGIKGNDHLEGGAGQKGDAQNESIARGETDDHAAHVVQHLEEHMAIVLLDLKLDPFEEEEGDDKTEEGTDHGGDGADTGRRDALCHGADDLRPRFGIGAELRLQGGERSTKPVKEANEARGQIVKELRQIVAVGVVLDEVRQGSVHRGVDPLSDKEVFQKRLTRALKPSAL